MRLKAGLAVLAALAFGAPAGAQDVGDIGSTATLKAAKTILTSGKRPCGGAADAYLCGTLNASGWMASEPLKLDLRKGDVVTVTWQGSVYCSYHMNFETSSEDVRYRSDVLGTIQLQTGKPAEPPYNADGSVSFGGKDFATSLPSRLYAVNKYFLHPIHLTRRFVVEKTGKMKFFVSTRIEFREITLTPTCNVNGGSMTATVLR